MTKRVLDHMAVVSDTADMGLKAAAAAPPAAAAPAAAAAAAADPAPVKRPVCAGCGRPLRVCYCAALPAQPLQLTGHVVILQHPHELK